MAVDTKPKLFNHQLFHLNSIPPNTGQSFHVNDFDIPNSASLIQAPALQGFILCGQYLLASPFLAIFPRLTDSHPGSPQSGAIRHNRKCRPLLATRHQGLLVPMIHTISNASIFFPPFHLLLHRTSSLKPSSRCVCTYTVVRGNRLESMGTYPGSR
ncbi:hypothetical protein K504DRAFT_498798 [Pleomassaria siparia CBS 279.74]|uniref:Uncharacterized protein n=1 Tax=Pleomassaria siparia CBS 279.74 TaxID=1314801 RepID=A0A6G1KMD6_9PLEO|nr:hypothetical protein K504DRAFT_498798 [Pleomassaria siparia CBS 279.74]